MHRRFFAPTALMGHAILIDAVRLSVTTRALSRLCVIVICYAYFFVSSCVLLSALIFNHMISQNYNLHDKAIILIFIIHVS